MSTSPLLHTSDILQDHYRKIASTYNHNWWLCESYRSWYIEHVIRFLELNRHDVVVDMGSGTGMFAYDLLQRSPITTITCVEPSVSMCDVARQYQELDVVTMDAISYLKSTSTQATKILLKEMIHHIPDRKLLFDHLFTYLHSDGKLSLITRPQVIDFPFFKKAKEYFLLSQPDYKEFVSELVSSGFSVEVFKESFPVVLDKACWHRMIRERFMSHLTLFNDEEIEEGIDAISSYISEDGSYHFNDHLIFINATKRR